MSNFSNTRRAPNVSQYIANLNTVPTQQELAAQGDDFTLGDDLAFLTNTEFFDFDNFNGTVGDFPAQEAPPQPQEMAQKPSVNGPQYQFGEFQTYPTTMTASPTSLPTSPPNGLPGAYPSQSHPNAHAFSAQAQLSAGDKRKASMAGLPTAADLEEASRVAAEEDKRRRNTAASARFRVKKKQREQALEKQAKEMTDKVSALESRVQQLETENKWLKDLLTEKSDSSKTGEVAASDMADKEGDERSSGNRTDGVGTVEDVKAEA